MSRILGRNQRVFSFGELHFFEHLWTDAEVGRVLAAEDAVIIGARLLNIQRRGYFLGPKDFSPFLQEARGMLGGGAKALMAMDVFEEFLYYEAARHGASIPCEQTPRDLYYLREILDAFPSARVVVMVRDPRAILLSQKRKWRRRDLGESKLPRVELARAWFNYHPIVTSRLWNAAVEAGLAVAEDPRVTSVRFEDLMADPEGTVERLGAFVGFEFQPEMLHVPQWSSSNEPDSVDFGVKAERADAWRQGGLSHTEIAFCEWITGTRMSRFGYARTGARPNPFAVVGQVLRLPFHLAGALVLNFRRSRSLVSAVRRRLRRPTYRTGGRSFVGSSRFPRWRVGVGTEQRSGSEHEGE